MSTQITTRQEPLVTVLQNQNTLQQLAMALPRHVNAERFARVAITEVRRNPDLAKCDPASFMSCLVQSAQLGLEIGSGLGHAYMIPFHNNKSGKSDATLVIGYRGLLDLIRRSGLVKSVSAHVVYLGDIFDFQFGSDEFIKHKPQGDSNPTNITHAYAIAEFKDGARQLEVMTRSEIDRVRDGGRKNPVWDKHYGEMARKTALRRLSKYMPLSPELADAITVDARSDEILEMPERPDPKKTMAIQVAAAEAENKERAKVADAVDRKILTIRFEKAWEMLKSAGEEPCVVLGLGLNHDFENESNPAIEMFCEKMEAAR